MVAALAAEATGFTVDATLPTGRRRLRAPRTGALTDRADDLSSPSAPLAGSPAARGADLPLRRRCRLGCGAQWLRNVQAGTAVEVAVTRRRFRPVYRILEPQEASALLADYERRNRWVTPLVRWLLSRLVGWTYDGSTAARLRLVSQLPVVGVRPE